MADDKKNIPEAAPPAETPAPAVENTVVPEQSAPEHALVRPREDGGYEIIASRRCQRASKFEIFKRAQKSEFCNFVASCH